MLRKKVNHGSQSRRRRQDYKVLQKENEKELDRYQLEQNKKTYTYNQKFIGGVPIYVDSDVRD